MWLLPQQDTGKFVESGDVSIAPGNESWGLVAALSSFPQREFSLFDMFELLRASLALVSVAWWRFVTENGQVREVREAKGILGVWKRRVNST